MTRLAVAQLCCTPDFEKNFTAVKNAVTKAREAGAQFVCLPEACDYLGTGPDTVKYAQPLDGPLMQRYRALAAETGVWISLGGVHELLSDGSNGMANSHVVLNPEGEIAAVYRKMHLFDACKMRESDTTTAGNEIVVVRDTPVGDVGLSTCYDVRFPRLYQALARAGANLVLVPSAFMPKTGEAHWHVLLRARAIENGVYVAAAAQVGVHGGGRKSYGHSLVVGPWGDVLADGGEVHNAVKCVDIDQKRIAEVAEILPVHHHRRDDVFGTLPGAIDGMVRF